MKIASLVRALLPTLWFVLVACGEDGGGGGDDAPGDGGTGLCGGLRGVECKADEYCDYGANSCGVADEPGTCRPRPTVCPLQLIFSPTCGCDGTVYGGECDAYAAGTDLNASGSCKPEAGRFACGYRQCSLQGSYCERSVSDVGGEPDQFACNALPACTGQPSCACLSVEKCGAICAGSSATGMTLTCPGG